MWGLFSNGFDLWDVDIKARVPTALARTIGSYQGPFPGHGVISAINPAQRKKRGKTRGRAG